MALTSTTLLDVSDGIQTITFYEGSTVVDQITYSNNQITFSSISSYNLSKSDLLLYVQYLQVFLTLLTVNFRSLISLVNAIWPLCLFEISETNVGTTHITYTQSSNGTNVYTINYVPIAQAASFNSRSSPVSITFQEFYAGLNFMNLYSNQVSLN
jgi:hypothetical protein